MSSHVTGEEGDAQGGCELTEGDRVAKGPTWGSNWTPKFVLRPPWHAPSPGSAHMLCTGCHSEDEEGQFHQAMGSGVTPYPQPLSEHLALPNFAL